METGNILNQLQYILPEITITAFLLVLVVIDLFVKKNKGVILTAAASAGIAAAFVLVANNFVTTAALDMSWSGSSSLKLVSVDPFGNFFKLLILLTSIFIVFFSVTSKEITAVKDRIGEYYELVYGMILGMMFMVSASDMILIYLSIEVLSLSSFVLAGFTDTRKRNSEASLKYLLYGAASSGIMLFGISILYGLTGTTNLVEINSIIRSFDTNLLTLSLSLILILAGIGYKISVAPFHFWAPDVYEGAPVTITAYLSVASKAAGFALLIRFLRFTFVSGVQPEGNWDMLGVFDWQSVLVVIALLTMTLGNFSALWQDNVKRMLAYSSIAHAGYILLGVAVMSEEGITAVVIYLMVYMVMNIGAFYIVSLIADNIGSENLDDYNGLGKKLPFLGVSLTIFLISLTGLPPTAGFIGKLYLFIALIDANMITVALIALLNTVVSLYYYVRVLKHMFLTDKEDLEVKPTPKSGLIFVGILVVPIIFFGLYFTPVVEFAKSAIAFTGF